MFKGTPYIVGTGLPSLDAIKAAAHASTGHLPAVLCLTCSRVVADAYEGISRGRHKAFCKLCRSNGTADRTIRTLERKNR